MVTIISRIVHYGFKNFWRNGLLSTATVAIVSLCLVVFGGLIFANAMSHSFVSFLQGKIDVTAWFRVDTPEDEILSVKQSLEALPEVQNVEYVSADRTKSDFLARHPEEQYSQSLEELNANPFEASLNVKAKDPNQYKAIADYLNTDSLAKYISSVSYNKNQDVIDNLVGVIGGVNRAGLVLTIVLSFIAGLVVFNTIRLVIYSNRDEIAIMRAVGASNAFVRGPYVIEGIITGVIAAVLSLLVILALILLAPLFYHSQYFTNAVPGFSAKGYFGSHILSLLFYQVLFGVGLASISSFIAVRRYLRN